MLYLKIELIALGKNVGNQYHLVFHKENFRSGPYNSSLIEFMGKRFALMFSKYEVQSELPVNVDSSAEFLNLFSCGYFP